MTSQLGTGISKSFFTEPMQLLVDMMELCPNDEEASSFSVFLFMQCLPTWLRILLEADDQDYIWQLAVKADRLLTLQG